MSPERAAKYLAIFTIIFGAATAGHINFVAPSLGQPGGISFNWALLVLGGACVALGVLALRKLYWAYYLIAVLFVPQVVQLRFEDFTYSILGAIHLSVTLQFPPTSLVSINVLAIVVSILAAGAGTRLWRLRSTLERRT